MTAPGGVSPTPINLSPTEHEQIARVFESGPSLFSLLSTIRTRRFGLGYRSETGETEMQAWSPAVYLRTEGADQPGRWAGARFRSGMMASSDANGMIHLLGG